MKTIKMDYDEYERMQTLIKMFKTLENKKNIFLPWNDEWPDYRTMELITTEEAQQFLEDRVEKLIKARNELVQIKKDIADRKEIKKTHWLIKKPW